MVEVWFKGGMWPLESNPVGFSGGPIRTAADGSFQTPDNLLVGSQYRVVVRAPGIEPILSDWITIDEKPRVLFPLLQRPLRTISGRVVDRQGNRLPESKYSSQVMARNERASRRMPAAGSRSAGFAMGRYASSHAVTAFGFLGVLSSPATITSQSN